MAIERTLSIIKPDAVKKNVIGQIYSRFEGAGLKVIAARMTWLSEQEAGQFYAVHKARPFFGELVEEIGIPAISEHLMTVIDRRLACGENDAMAQVLEDK